MEQVASFLEKMEKKPDQELLDIITVQKENYQPDALKAAVIALKKREVDYRTYIKEYEAEQHQEQEFRPDLYELAGQIAQEEESRQNEEIEELKKQVDEQLEHLIELKESVTAQKDQNQSTVPNPSMEGEKQMFFLRRVRNKHRVYVILLLFIIVPVLVFQGQGLGISVSFVGFLSLLFNVIKLYTVASEYRILKKTKAEVKAMTDKSITVESRQLAIKAYDLFLAANEDKKGWETFVNFLNTELKSKEQAEQMLKAQKVMYYFDMLKGFSQLTTQIDKHNFLMAPFHKLGISDKY